MANSVSHASIPYPIKNARYTIAVPYLDADGDPTDPTTPDTELSGDGGAYADCAEEVTTITGSNGTGYITLSGAETNYSLVAVCAKVASGPKATLAILQPRNLPILESGTAGAGAAGTITLASGTYTGLNLAGCFIRTTGGTGGGGTGGANNQARRITSYNTSTRVATVTPNWETTPDNTTTYDVLLPEGILVPMLTALAPTTLARTLDVSSGGEAGLDWANVGSPTTTLALTGTTIASTQKVDLETIKTQAVTCAGGVTVPAATLASTTNITAATGITVATNSDKTGYSLTATTGLGNQTANITGNLSGSVGSVTGNVGGNVTGSVGSISGITFPTNFSAMAITVGGIVSADLQTIKTQSVTCAAGVTVLASVGTASTSTAQTGDAFARIGAAGAGLTALGDTRIANLDATVSSRAAASSFTFTVAGKVDCNIQYVNDVQIGGVGTSGDPWGPA